MFKILDCTLRDGGYYTNWDFDEEVVNSYLKSMNHLPIDYLEVGYRSRPMKQYLGKYFYSPIFELQKLREKSNKKLVIILNEKDVRVESIKDLLGPCLGLIDMVRLAIDPENLKRALRLAEGIKEMNFEVGFNVMYMSKWKQYPGFLNDLGGVDGLADFFYMVDSFGGVYPDDVKATMDLVRSKTDCPIGFHGHNNLELALTNSLTAIEYGAKIIDATILGMGRGAGNLKTELLLSVLNNKYQWDVDYNALGNSVNAFEGLMKKYQWGTNLPYMISGSNSLPQKDVMDWVTARFYSFNSIIQALQNKKNNVEDNEQLPPFNPTKTYSKAVIIGGGGNAVEHAKAISEFVNAENDICVIHASSKNASQFKSLKTDQFYCLVGNEGHRLESVFNSLGEFEGRCVLPPYPRKMGTYIPPSVAEKCYELNKVEFTKKLTDTHTTLALQAAIDLGAKKIYLVGYDGYQEASINQLERMLVEENEYLFRTFSEFYNIDLIALTPSRYDGLVVQSIYSMVYEK